MDIKVCIGSACHLKGSYDVIEALKAKIVQHDLDGKVVLKASFCLGKCGDGVTVKADDEFISGVLPSTINEIFDAKILPKVK